MEQINEIRKYFKPLQPSVNVGDQLISYKEFKPDFKLMSFIHCYWKLETKQELHEPYMYRVVSDGCIDIFFNLHDTEESFVMGFCNRYTEFNIGKRFSFGGIRFYPSAFPLLFEISANKLLNKDIELKLVLPELANFIKVQAKVGFLALLPKLNKSIISNAYKIKEPLDQRFFEAFIEILKSNGNLEIEKHLKTGISPRHLRRLFSYYVGTSPKSFCQVVRFQYILNVTLSSQSIKDDKLYYDVGFFDQAHFIKSFSKYYGVTPSKAFH